jgi:TolB-like protein/DNA-binding SARP family transcriptional activator/Tfp pilus assembly protein PilF
VTVGERRRIVDATTARTHVASVEASFVDRPMDPNPPAARLSVLGPAELFRADGTAVRSVLTQPKRVALLAFLRLAGEGGAVTRDSILGTFWPELTEERALAALRQGVHFLRRSLGSDAIERDGEHLLRVRADLLACDAEAFHRAVSEGRLEAALELYRGPFLDGLPVDGSHALEEWLERNRRRYRDLAVRAASGLAELALHEGRHVAAADWARRLSALDPFEERGVALLIEAHAAAGDPVAAARAYDAFARVLARELDLEPSAGLTERVGAVQRAGSAAADPADPGLVQDRAPKPASEPAPAAAIAPPAPVDAPRPEAASRRSWWGYGWVAALAAVAILVAAWRLLPERAGADAPVAFAGERPSLAVLPFRNLSPDSTNAFFAAGVHESVLFNLSRIGSIDVTALRAVRAYADSVLPTAEIARRLDVASLMSGSVQREGDRIRINVELVEPSTGTQLWSATYDRRLGDVFAVQTDIARSVANSLRAVLTPAEEDRIARAPTASVEALDHFMRARAAYADGTLSGMEAAIRQYGQAARVDPDFAAAWAGLADAYLQRVQFFGYPLTWADTARALVDRAIELDPELPEAYKTLGFVHSVHGRDRAALEAAERAVELRPAYADALNNAGWSRYFLGDVAAAERLIRRSFRLQPTVPQLRSNVGAILAALGRTEEATEWLDGVLRTNPSLTATRTWRTFVDIERGDPATALQRAEGYLGDESPDVTALARAGYAALLAGEPGRAAAYAARALDAAPGVDLFDMRRVETVLGAALVATGDVEEGRRRALDALAAVEERVADGADGWDPPWELAAAHAVLGDRDEALRQLAAAVDEGFPHPVLMRLDPGLDPLRGDPRFEELLSRAERHADLQREESRAPAG